jgi:YjbR protein
MGPEAFRKLALSLPGAEEREHMDHPDFRADGHIFATLGYPDEKWAMVKLTPEQQAEFVQKEPEVFNPVKGKWGLRGATQIRLKGAASTGVKKALEMARENLKAKKKVR